MSGREAELYAARRHRAEQLRQAKKGKGARAPVYLETASGLPRWLARLLGR